MDTWQQVPSPLLRVSCQPPLEDSYSLSGSLLALLLPHRAVGREKQSMLLVLGCLHPVPGSSLTSCGAVASCANPHCHDVFPKCSVCAEQVTLCSTWHFLCPQLNKGLRADRVGMMVTGRRWAGRISHASISLQRPVAAAVHGTEGSPIL